MDHLRLLLLNSAAGFTGSEKSEDLAITGKRHWQWPSDKHCEFDKEVESSFSSRRLETLVRNIL